MLHFDTYDKKNVADLLKSMKFYEGNSKTINTDVIGGQYRVEILVDTFDEWGYDDVDTFIIYVNTPEEVQYIKNNID